jgi:hypothetical protein
MASICPIDRCSVYGEIYSGTVDCKCDSFDDGGDCATCDGSGELPHDCGDDTCCCLNPSGDSCPECGGA